MHLIYIKYLLKSIVFKIGNFGFKSKVKFLGLQILTPWNHPFFLWRFNKKFNRNIARVAKVINKNDYIVDVGASIGDTYAVLRGEKIKSNILLIEGGKKANYYLSINTQNDKKSQIFNGLVGPKLKIDYLETLQSGITRLNSEGSNSLKSCIPLEEVIKEYIPVDKKVGLIKVDTDGFDTQVIRSGLSVLKKDNPILFIEAQLYHLLNNDDLTKFLEWINNLDYKKAIIWDNHGNFIMESKTISHELKYLLSYLHGSPNHTFTDIALFHEKNNDLFELILSKEKEIYLKNLATSVKDFPIKALKKVINNF